MPSPLAERPATQPGQQNLRRKRRVPSPLAWPHQPGMRVDPIWPRHCELRIARTARPDRSSCLTSDWGGETTHQLYSSVTHEFFGMGAVVPKTKEARDFAVA